MHLADWLINIDSIVDLLQAGGPVMYLIALNSSLIGAIVVDRSLAVWGFKFRLRRERNQLTHLCDGLKDRKREFVREMFRAQLAEQLSARLNGLRTLTVVSPFLGVLGTVTGMIEVFDVLQRDSTGNSSALSAGISRATLPTATAMLVTVPALLAYTYLRTQIERQIDIALQIWERA